MSVITGIKKFLMAGGFHTDWISVILLFAATGITSLIPPYCRYYPPGDPLLNFPHTPDEVSSVVLMLICGVVAPLLVVLPQVALVNTERSQRWKEVHCALLVVVSSLALTVFVTELGKVFAGRLRPDFFDRLKEAGYTVEQVADWRSACDNRSKDIISGRKSFPSGHSSMSMSTLGSVSFYWAAKLKALHPWEGRLWKIVLCMLPILGAGVVAVSRTRDFHHNFADILAGICIGFVVAFIIHHLYFPALYSDQCHQPRRADSTASELVELNP